jgi:hypothetical protein
MRRFMLVLAMIVALTTGLAARGSATPSQQVTIQTSKPLGPLPGIFAATDAFVDTGTINNLRFLPRASGAPTFGVVHLTILFSGGAGTFTVDAQITETLTSATVATDSGTWTIMAGTGAYATLHGTGTVTGTVNDNTNLITRTFVGDVHFN